MLLHPSQAKCGRRVCEIFSQGETKFLLSLVSKKGLYTNKGLKIKYSFNLKMDFTYNIQYIPQLKKMQECPLLEVSKHGEINYLFFQCCPDTTHNPHH